MKPKSKICNNLSDIVSLRVYTAMDFSAQWCLCNLRKNSLHLYNAIFKYRCCFSDKRLAVSLHKLLLLQMMIITSQFFDPTVQGGSECPVKQF